MATLKVAPRTAISLYVALAVHALLLLGLVLRPPSQNPAGTGLGLGIPGTGLDEIERRLVTAPQDQDGQRFEPVTSALLPDRTLEVQVEVEAKKSDPAKLKPDSGPARKAARPERAVAGSERHAGGRMGGGGSDSYFARLRSHLAGFRHELRGGLPSATARVRVQVSPEGWISGLEIVESSGLAELDAEALNLLRRAAPLPPPPDGRATRLIVPVSIGGQG